MFKNQKFTTAMYLVLSLIMGLCIFFCAIFSSLKFTFFSPSFLTETLNSTNYYKDVCAEITDDLVNLGDASGLDKSFFEDFVDEVMVRKDVQYYINDFYAGEKLRVNTLDFQKALRTALDQFINKKGLTENDFSQESVNNFVKEASEIYASDIELAYFPQIQKSINKYNTRIIVFIAVTLALFAAIAAVIILTNKWKHIAVRYIYYATASAGLLTAAVPVTVLLSGVVSRIAILNRSLNDLYTAGLHSLLYTILFIGLALIVLSGFLWVLHNKLRKNVSN